MTKLLICHCSHEYQDKRYGQFRRLHNYAPKKNLWRCTVCKQERAG